MGRFTAYIFQEEVPPAITIAGVRYSFLFGYERGYFSLRVTKECECPKSIILCAADGGPVALSQVIYRDGFEAERGSDAQRFALCLLRRGYLRLQLHSRKGRSGR